MLFFLFATTMSGLALLSLLTPGGRLEPLWRVNPRGRAAFTAMGTPALVLLGVLCLACAATAAGLFLLRRWGWTMAVVILAINATGDLSNAVLLRDGRTLVGLPIVALMILYLVRVRPRFGSAPRR